ncbi:ATP-binding cassette domain-containing protein [Candidatus Pelagibacter sp. Uisw_113]|uniref:ATP-binding cassette domain-containing protein n=1 Tax=Candidatus Pelagibacter sp. Uisw_113 TaxID=3230994 RepID=UPI0039E9164D
MFKKAFTLLSNNNKSILFTYFILTLIFVAIETSLLIIVFPLIDVFLGSQSVDQNKVFLFLKNYLYIKDLNGLINFGIIFVIFRLLYFLFYNWAKYSYLNIIQKDLAINIFKKYYDKSFLEFIKLNSASFVRDISSETTTFKKFCDTAIVLILEIFISISICIFLYFIDPLIFLYVAGFLAIFAIIYFMLILKILVLLGKRRVLVNKKIIKVANESYKFFELIKINNVLNFFNSDLKREFQELLKVNRTVQIINLIPRLFIETILFLGFLLIFLIQFKNSGFNINLSTAGIFLVCFLRLFPSISKIMGAIQILNLSKFSVENIYLQISEETKNNKKNQESPINFNKEIQIKNLNLKYKDKKVFNNFDCLIQNKSFNAIVGKSGSGKSSFIKIFTGLLEANEIQFMLDEKKVDIYENKNWQKNIGYAGQNSIILNQSLKRNISLSKDEETNSKKLSKVFYESGLDIFLDFEKNINDEINEAGSNFSGGQLQRICLARALYFSKGILVLDEICSSLDMESEKEIILTLKKLSKEYTIIYITHRNNFYEYFDNIIKL